MEKRMYKTKAAAKKATEKEIVKMVIEDLIDGYQKDQETTVFRILNAGRLLEGSAYNHETDQSYTEIGLELEVEYKFHFMKESTKHVGFYSIWTASKKSYDPVDFDESYQEIGKPHRFSNGFGDYLTVTKELKSLEDMQKALGELIKEKKIKLSK